MSIFRPVIVTLDNRLKLVAPIFGVAIGRKNDKSTWRIDFKPEATAAEKILAQDVIDAFDVDTEEAEIDTDELRREDDRSRIRALPDVTPVTVKTLRELGLL